jgi:nitronate monooxygenase
MTNVLDELAVAIVQAPLAGGPSTPELAAAVCNAGALGFVAAGYKTADAMREDIARTRAGTDRPFGVNVFVPGRGPADPAAVAAYAERLEADARRAGVALGAPRFDDDDFDAKLAALRDERVALASFTFGCPAPDVVEGLQRTGIAVWVTVTDVEEARAAAEAGADALVVQGVEAGGHRGSFVDRDDRVDYGILALVQLVSACVDLPLVAAGAVATGAAVAAVLVAGAAAAQVGTAFMRCPEAATSPAQRAALASARPTGLTRAFSGRLARGIVNRLQAEHTGAAPIAYPEVHHLTAPLRAHGRSAGDPDLVNLWAGQAHELAQEAPAAEVVARLDRDARRAIADGQRKLLGRRATDEPGRAGP